MSTPTTEYVFDPGIDPTATFGGYASVLLQLIELAVPNAIRGMVIYSEDEPATTGQPTGYPTDWYAWQKRCVWIRPSTGELFVYKEGLSWQAVEFGTNSINGTSIIDGTITIDKLAPTGAARQLIQINAGETAWEFVDPANIFSTGTVDPTYLIPGTNGQVLITVAGAATWTTFNSAYILNLIANGDIPVEKLAAGAPNTVLQTNSSGDVSWQALGTVLGPATLPVTTLTRTGGYAYAVSRVNSANTAVEWGNVDPSVITPGTAGQVLLTNSGGTAAAWSNMFTDTTPIALANTISIAHTLGTVPKMWRLICKTTDNTTGYASTDEIPIESITAGGSGSYEPNVSMGASTTAITATLVDSGGNPPTILKKGTVSSIVNIDYTKWTVFARYSNF